MIPPEQALMSLAVVLFGELRSQLPIKGGMAPSNPASSTTKMAANRRLKVVAASWAAAAGSSAAAAPSCACETKCCSFIATDGSGVNMSLLRRDRVCDPTSDQLYAAELAFCKA
jgi:hypothetical protein